ncbi:hypothetical protein RFI_08073 [Reticulomyxa filosa]|uniref:Uncharacterized protein n=1 Tax=Reticulomyxa filosa TaxID=46433 RepID=X6NSS9_RETFI|nr:hypothetical protein RFI_08073 [Reticulomyxa filosa]|eukprot:ETO29056.1 hypothetical protein RFI_08073 [Reticulomyxa filosa]
MQLFMQLKHGWKTLFCLFFYLLNFFSHKSVFKVQNAHMANPTTPQKPPKTLTEQIQDVAATNFEFLEGLPTPLEQTECVLHKHELLICGSVILFIRLKTNSMKLVDNNKDSNEITLLSFGGSKYTTRHIDDEICKCLEQSCNLIHIGSDDDQGVRVVIGGSNKDLSFITYSFDNISIKKKNNKSNMVVLSKNFQFHHLFVMILRHSEIINVYASMISSCSLVDIIIEMTVFKIGVQDPKN